MSDPEQDDIAEDPKPFCPKCGSVDIRRSQTRRTLDFLLRTFSLCPYRCRSCRKRFYMRTPIEDEVEDADSPAEESQPEAEAKHRQGG